MSICHVTAPWVGGQVWLHWEPLAQALMTLQSCHQAGMRLIQSLNRGKIKLRQHKGGDAQGKGGLEVYPAPTL